MSAILSNIDSGILLNINSDLPPHIESDTLFYLTISDKNPNLLPDSNSDSWGPVENTAMGSSRLVGYSAIGSLRLRSLRSGGEHCHRELAVEVRWGTLPSGACGWGPMGSTAIGSLRLRSGGEHCHRELAVEVRWGTLPSGACGWGLMGNTAIGSLRVRSGGEHCRRKLSGGREGGGGRHKI